MCDAGRGRDLRRLRKKGAVAWRNTVIGTDLGKLVRHGISQRGICQSRKCLGRRTKIGDSIVGDDRTLATLGLNLAHGLNGLQQSVHRLFNASLHGRINYRIQGLHLWVQVFSQADFLNEILPHVASSFKRGCSLRFSSGIRHEPTHHLSSPGLAKAIQEL